MNNFTKQEKEDKFNNFLNKTIILSSKKFYKEEFLRNYTEQKLIDDEKTIRYVEELSQHNDNIYSSNNIYELMEQIDNVSLFKALKSLSDIEMIVIFLLFEKQFTSSEASKILEICSDSVTRIKRRALKKLQDYMKGDR